MGPRNVTPPTLSSGQRRRLHDYLLAFLPPSAAQESLDELTEDLQAWGLGDDVAAFAAAHNVLASRLRVAVDAEALVLVDDVHLATDQAAVVLGVDEAALTAELDRARDEVAAFVGAGADDDSLLELEKRHDELIATEPGSLASPRRRGAMGLVILLAGAVMLVVTWTMLRPAGPAAPIEVTDVRLTSEIDSSGNPGPERAIFTIDERVRLWFEFQRNGDAPLGLTIAWYRADELLYSSPFALPRGNRVHVTLAELFKDELGEVGDYRVLVQSPDEILIDLDFAIRSEP